MELVVGIVGALLGGFASYLGQRTESARMARKEVARGLLATWHSLEMVRARVVGYEALLENLRSANPKTFEMLAADLIKNGRTDEWVEASQVIHYFELLARTYHANELDTRILRECMTPAIDFWFEKVFEPTAALDAVIDPSGEMVWFEPVRRLHQAVQRQ